MEERVKKLRSSDSSIASCIKNEATAAHIAIVLALVGEQGWDWPRIGGSRDVTAFSSINQANQPDRPTDRPMPGGQSQHPVVSEKPNHHSTHWHSHFVANRMHFVHCTPASSSPPPSPPPPHDSYGAKIFGQFHGNSSVGGSVGRTFSPGRASSAKEKRKEGWKMESAFHFRGHLLHLELHSHWQFRVASFVRSGVKSGRICFLCAQIDRSSSSCNANGSEGKGWVGVGVPRSVLCVWKHIFVVDYAFPRNGGLLARQSEPAAVHL